MSVERFNPEGVPRFHFGEPGVCAYCGSTGDEVDHCIPYTFLNSAKNRRKGAIHGITTQACRWCNGRLSDRMFPTMRERVDFMQKRFLARAKRYAKHGSWTPEEINKLDWTLQTFVASRQLEIAWLDSAVTWIDSPGYREFYHELKWRPELDATHARYSEFLANFFQGYT